MPDEAKIIENSFGFRCKELGIIPSIKDIRRVKLRYAEMRTLGDLGVLSPPVSKEKETEAEPSGGEIEVHSVDVSSFLGSHLNIWIDPLTWKDLVNLCGDNRVTIQQVICTAIKQYIDTQFRRIFSDSATPLDGTSRGGGRNS